ncbi:LamG-like jellyroll fold domain-containing protein [Thalassoglobus sp.]|uniref:LamG-like jellyroll fold domain-containing protein n=1 Tax=Thalassoglobus sp. TaxID=2795869 RepID=UPI003AA970B2
MKHPVVISKVVSIALFTGLISFASLGSIAVADEVVGPIVGTVEPTTARILYRPGKIETKLQLTVLKNGQPIKEVTTTALAANDFVAKFEVTGLKPATNYSYQIDEIRGNQKEPVAAGKNHTFTTVDPARKGNRVSASFASCVDIEPNGIWSEMEKLGVDTVFLMGDTPYIDTSDLAIVREKQRQLLQVSDLEKLAAHTPVVGTWDDHDFGLNNGNGLNMMNGKGKTRQGFVEYRAHSQYGNGSEGVYHKVDLGMMEVFLLDPRFFSQTEPSPVDPKQPTCFGAEQWKWLLKSLKESKAPFKVLSMGAIWQDKKNRETDDMFTYWYERDALLDFIKTQKISGVVLLGGDIHVARHLIHPQRVGYDLHDFIISPGHTRTITSLNVYHPSLEWSLVEGWQFLTLTADGTTENAKLIAEFRQPDGVLNRKVEIELNAMTVDSGEKTSPELRAHWNFDNDFKNESPLGSRIDATPVNGPTITQLDGALGGSVHFSRNKQQYLTVPRSFLDDNSAAHTVSMWFKPETLPEHGSSSRSFLLESTAEGEPNQTGAWNLSLGMRATDQPDKINLQLYTYTVKPALKPEAAPTTGSQGPFNMLLDRDQLLGKWNHVAFTFDQKRLRLFVNGKQVSEHALPVPGPACETGGLIIGGHRAGTGRNFDGWIDDVRIFQGQISATQISELRNESKD